MFRTQSEDWTTNGQSYTIDDIVATSLLRREVATKTESTSLTEIENTDLCDRLVAAIEKRRESEIGTENK